MEAANSSLSYHTWRQHRSVLSLMKKCQGETGVCLNLPWSETAHATFIAWCLKREVRSSTIEVYKSKIRKIHTMHGLPWLAGSSTLTSAAIKGRQNTQPKVRTRLPITPATLLLLKHRIRVANWPIVKKRLVWAISATLFVGSFRVSEILAAKSNVHVKDNTLLNKNILECVENISGSSRNFLKVHLENPKEDRNRLGVHVELFELPGLFFDPVKALRQWRAASCLEPEPTQPVFRWENGLNVTPSDFNACLKSLLRNDIKYEDGKVTSHSFRAGVATTMARLGYGEDMIQLQGRWVSQAYLRYCKRGRVNRLEDQFNLFSSLATAAAEANIN